MRKKSYVYFQRLFEHLDRDTLVVVFPQGKIEEKGVKTFKSGITELIRIYELKQGREVNIIPGGIEYQFPKGLPKKIPIPTSKFPFPGTKATLRIGKPKHIHGRDSMELTEIVMREAARLSNINYIKT